MNRILWVCVVAFSCVSSTFGQQPAAMAPAPGVPRLVSFGGTIHVASGKAKAGVVGITFAIYKEQQEGAPLWMETQNVVADNTGHYTVQLGSTKSDGLPVDLFISGEARWLGVQVSGQDEQPRVLLLSVPYAMKAADAETLGGLPRSAFALAAPSASGGVSASNDANAIVAAPSALPPASTVTTTGGTVNAIPLFTTGTNIQNSILTQSATSAINVGGKLNLLATGTATASGGKNSQPEVMVASVFNSGTSTAVAQKFEWQAEPVNNNKTTASGTLNLLYGSGTAVPAETGLKVNNKGQITFASGQTFPGTGTGTVVSVGTGLGLKGGPITNTGTLTIDTTVVPRLNAANTFTGNQTVTGNLTASGAVTGASSTFTGSTIGVSGAGSQYGGIFSTSTGGTGLYAFNSADCPYCVGIEGYAFGNDNRIIGVFGSTNSPFGVGVYGQLADQSTLGAGVTSISAGVWGDGAHNPSAGGLETGVLATADNNSAILAYNNSHVSNRATIEAYSQDPEGYSFLASGEGEGGYCHIDANGNLGCTGVVSGVVGVDVGFRKVYPVEAPQNWFEDAGSGKLSDGKATINLEPIFGQTVNTGIEYHVFLTPAGDCEGLYVSNKTPKGFEVHELRGGHSSVAFDYRIMATRKGYEGVRLAEERHPPDPAAKRRSLFKKRVEPARSQASGSVQTPSGKKDSAH